jgi:putative ABC transport system permease protein
MNINLLESVKLATRTLAANKLRTFLTMLGISIGVGAVIALLAIGTGVQNYINQQFTSSGTNLLGITPGRIQRGGPPGGFGQSAYLTLNDYRAVTANVGPGVTDHATDFTSVGNFAYEGKTSQVQVSGVTPSFSAVRNWKASTGRFIEEADNGGRARVVVLGQTVVNDLFPEEDPLDKVVKINNVPFRVIGVMESKGSSFLGDQDATAFIPLTTAQERLFARQAQAKSGERIVSTIYLHTADDQARPQVEAAAREVLRERHRLQPGDNDDFSIISQTELLNTFGAVTDVLTIFLGAIAAISLLVGGIGIMNIMLVSVTERTREIGLRKAIGAKAGAILSQFLIEAIVLSLIGGALGILIGAGIALGITLIPNIGFQPTVQVSAIALAVGFSIAVGLFFGIYPARRASKLNPIDALRFE